MLRKMVSQCTGFGAPAAGVSSSGVAVELGFWGFIGSTPGIPGHVPFPEASCHPSTAHHGHGPRWLELHRLSVHAQGSLARLENPQYPPAVVAIGLRCPAALDAFQEMAAFQQQRFIRLKFDGSRGRLLGNELPVDKPDLL